jgi:Holliday junction DNA helicase RuvB
VSGNKVFEKLREVVTRYGDDAVEYLRKIREEWLKYKSSFKCYQCDSTNVRWLDDFTYECDRGHGGGALGLESWEFKVPPWFMRVLHDKGLVQVLYRSRSATCYGVPEETLKAIESILSEGAEEVEGAEVYEEPEAAEMPEPTVEMFSDIVGLDDIKELVVRVLKADKPVHLLLVGPPASAKTMILEAISERYGVPIMLAGTSTKAGLREFIVENKPTIMLIDELDKIANPLDLSVLLTWMQSQRLTVTMDSRRVTVKCPSVCKVIAAANRADKLPPELLSRFIVVEIKPYTERDVYEICVNVLTRKEGKSREVAEVIARAVVEKLRSKDPRDCIKIARLAKRVEDVDRIIETLRR